MHREAHRLSLRQFQPRWAQASDGPSIISHFESIGAWTGHVGVWDSLDIFPGCPSFSKESIVALLGPFFLSHMKRAIEFVHKVQDLYFVWFPADFSINGAAASNLQRSAILQVKKKNLTLVCRKGDGSVFNIVLTWRHRPGVLYTNLLPKQSLLFMWLLCGRISQAMGDSNIMFLSRRKMCWIGAA